VPCERTWRARRLASTLGLSIATSSPPPAIGCLPRRGVVDHLRRCRNPRRDSFWIRCCSNNFRLVSFATGLGPGRGSASRNAHGRSPMLALSNCDSAGHVQPTINRGLFRFRPRAAFVPWHADMAASARDFSTCHHISAGHAQWRSTPSVSPNRAMDSDALPARLRSALARARHRKR